MSDMASLLNHLFFKKEFGSVWVRDICTLTIALQHVPILNVAWGSKILSLMFVPLLVSMLGEYVYCGTLKLHGTGCSNAISEVKVKRLQDGDFLTAFSYAYKCVLFWYICMHIRPQFNAVNVIFGGTLVAVFLMRSDVGAKYGVKSNTVNNGVHILSMLTVAIAVFFLLCTIYHHIHMWHAVVLFAVYCLTAM